jgi:hypothetical protein
MAVNGLSSTNWSPPLFRHCPLTYPQWDKIDQPTILDGPFVIYTGYWNILKPLELMPSMHVDATTTVIGDNITALKWASVDAVTPGDVPIVAAYNWLKEHIRDH